MPARLAFVTILVATIAVSATRAAAQPSATPAATIEAQPAPRAPGKRYIAQVLAADLASVGLFAIGSKLGEDGQEAFAMLGSLGLIAGGPAVHAAYGNPRGARRSLAARLLLPLAGGLTGVAIATRATADGDDRSDSFGEAIGEAAYFMYYPVVGTLAGLVASRIYDIFLAREPARSEVARPNRAPSRTVTPTIAVTGGSATFGLAGSY